MSSVRVLSGFLLVVVCITSGCGKSKGPETAIVSGKVTLDGSPLADGSISFIPMGAAGTPSGAQIVNGTYTATVPLGDKRVEIRATKVIGQKVAYEGDPNSPKYDIKQEIIPARYNSESLLRTTITTGSNSDDFSLESPKDAPDAAAGGQ